MAMVDMKFGLHLDCMGGTPECGQWQNRSSSQYVLEFSSGCFNVLWIFSIRWAYIYTDVVSVSPWCYCVCGEEGPEIHGIYPALHLVPWASGK